MMKLVLIVALCAVVRLQAAVLMRDVHAFPNQPVNQVEQAWAVFKEKHGKTYPTLEEEFRRQKIFAENLKVIESHNYLYEMGLKSYSMGINKFSDMKGDEVLNMMTGLLAKSSSNESHSMTYLPLNGVVLPDAVDWRKKGYVTPVKDQGGCGSCWAFSSTGCLEGQMKRKTGKLVSLSEQNLVDCSASTGNKGCEGGWMDYAYQYIEDNGGLDSEDSYPYTAREGKCHYKSKDKAATVTGIVDITSGDENMLKEAVATVGPVSVGIYVTINLQKYKKGIFHDDSCPIGALNHAVLIVGYGSENGKAYWIVKNSWSATWGENGYFRIVRNNNECGIASRASYPLV